MSLAPGTRLGRYEIRSKLGAGGMAEVYLAEDTGLGRRVALKLLPPDTTADEHARKRLFREARAVAALEHPHICAVYDVGEDAGHRFIAMQFVDGETLEARLKRQRLDLKEALSIACDVADALAEAHAHGIVHRDIKPSNVMVTPRGGAIVLDFGLAKAYDDDREQASAVTESLLSAPGAVIGTVPYMSPEQVRGEVLDGRSDIFSFGVMLYEMLTGSRPFADKTSAGTAAAILTRDPQPLTDIVVGVPPELARIVAKTLRKDPNERYQTAKDLLVDLRALKEDHAPPVAPARPRRLSRLPIVALAIIAIAGAGAWYAWRQMQVRAATRDVARLEALANEGKYFEAYDLAVGAERVLPRDPTLSRLMPTVAMTISVKSEPAGGTVYLKRFAPDPSGNLPARQAIGTTPITNLRVARGEYVLAIEKDGYAPSEGTISGSFARAGSLLMALPPVAVDQRLVPLDTLPARMVAVPGGEYRLAAWARPTDRRVRLDDFFIDKYEVSNQDFKEFISAGAYLKPDFWQVPFVKDGHTLSWDEAMKIFIDRSGLPGPRDWSGQNVPEGKSDHPVTDITWYEAAAYAAFRGKTLPTMFQWEKAARSGAGPAAVNFMPWGVFYPGDTLAHRANFDNNGTVPVTSLEFGMSPFGAYNMAGNAKEWTVNDTSEGLVATGGAWGDPTYVFAQYAMFPAFYSSNRLGFRCALTPHATSDEGSARIEINQEVPSYTASNAADFSRWRALYDYKPTPLDARVEDVQETPEWRLEKITFAGARGERAIAYLYLPHHFARPLQVISFVPGGDVERGLRSLPASMEDRLAPFIKAGRAAFGVVLTGYMERLRPGGAARPDQQTVEYFDELVNRITDLRRGLDYLATRPDLDAGRVAFFGPSAGGQLGLILAAVETRYRAVALVGSGLPASTRMIFASANPINFAAHIMPPKMMLHGKYDEDTPLKNAGMPLYALLPQPKRMVTFEGGHIPPDTVMFSTIGPFFDEVMGVVRR